jgi:hypothetical protein
MPSSDDINHAISLGRIIKLYNIAKLLNQWNTLEGMAA